MEKIAPHAGAEQGSNSRSKNPLFPPRDREALEEVNINFGAIRAVQLRQLARLHASYGRMITRSAALVERHGMKIWPFPDIRG